MRQENYLIALFNKELLDLRVPIPSILQPYFGSRLGDESKKGQVLTQALEWNLRFCLMSFLFDEGGRVRKSILKEKNRKVLVEGSVNCGYEGIYVFSPQGQPSATTHLHGMFECHFRAIHRTLPTRLFILQIF
jgi:hypothetical protein